jgi:hypothetical protein
VLSPPKQVVRATTIVEEEKFVYRGNVDVAIRAMTRVVLVGRMTAPSVIAVPLTPIARAFLNVSVALVDARILVMILPALDTKLLLVRLLAVLPIMIVLVA